VTDLAAAADGDVMAAWAGLGYYARARNLLACARAVARDHDGVFPDTETGLLRLPGVGAYTAAAVAAIAFDRPANVVDGNVERVISRLFAVTTPLPAAKPEFKALAARLIGPDRPGDWAQALMDLGATVCRPKAPLCERCPLSEGCRAHANKDAQTFPRKTAKAQRPHRHGVAYVLIQGDAVGLVRRPDRGLLGGMLALPSSDWGDRPAALDGAPASVDWRSAGSIEHVFTHFSLTLQVMRAEGAGDGLIWTPIAEAARALPSVFLKALKQGLNRLL
jgi:A/G-specific adenine glycosylase